MPADLNSLSPLSRVEFSKLNSIRRRPRAQSFRISENESPLFTFPIWLIDYLLISVAVLLNSDSSYKSISSSAISCSCTRSMNSTNSMQSLPCLSQRPLQKSFQTKQLVINGTSFLATSKRTFLMPFVWLRSEFS